jgi:uncharacterized membrane protein YkvA (DUF1232 family)
MARLKPPLRGASVAPERAPGDAASALGFIKDVALLLKDCAFDARVRPLDKWILVAVAVYLLSPVDLVPDAIPVLGQMDDLWLIIWALRRLLNAAGPAVVRDLWRGTEEGLAFVLDAAGMELRKDEV